MTMKVGGIEFDVIVDASGVRRATTTAVDDLEALHKKLRDTDKPAGGAGSALKGLGRNAGQAGIQIQQFVGQVQGGQSAMLALSQQSADLGFVLGMPLLGAVTGLAASFASVLVPSLFDAGESAKDLREELEELAKTQLLTEEQAKFLASTEKKSIAERKESIESIKEQVQEKKKLIKSREAELSGDVTPELMQRQSRYRTEVKEANEFILEQEAKLSLLTQQQEKAKTKLDAYNLAMSGSKKLSEDQQESIDAIKNSLTSQIVALQDGAQAAEVYAAEQRAIKDGTQSALPGIIEQINKKYEIIRANEAATQSEKDRVKAQLELDKTLTAIFENEKNRKLQVGGDLASLQEELASEEELRAQHLATRLEQLKEAQELELISQVEFDELKKEQVNSYLQWLEDRNKQSADERVKDEKAAQTAILALQRATVNNAIGLLDTFAGESKAAALASIALSKGLAIAQTIQNTGVAVMKAMAVDPTGALAARAKALGAINVAMIAATGLAQGASAMKGGSSQAYSGGVPATNTTSNQSDTGGTTQRNISIAVTGGIGSMDDLARQLVPALNEAIGDGFNFSVNGGR